MSVGGLQVLLLGPVRLLPNDVPVPLPRSRKVLALLAYLALDGTEQSRTRLCDLLWDGPNDPRGELRWCLSKLRALVDDPDRRRVVADGNTLLRLDLSDVPFDVRSIDACARAGISNATTEELVRTLALFRGDLVEGLELDGTPELSAWLAARRQSYRSLRRTIAQELARRPSTHPDAAQRQQESRQRIEAWLELEPFERPAHEALLELLARAGRKSEGDEHLARTIRTFEREGLDWGPLRAWWHQQSSAAQAGSIEAGQGGQAQQPLPEGAGEPHGKARASVAIMPFEPPGPSAAPDAAPSNQLALGLSDDIITRLAKLRALFVIARGTTAALAERGVDAREAGRILGVGYVVSGRVRRRGQQLSVTVELAETADARIVWTDEFACDGEATFSTLDSIIDRIVTAVAKEIEAAECQRAVLRPPTSLNAWEAYHRGLWHMYKFRPADNQQASHLFRAALHLDPTFARAHAGLSFTHFQNVFLELTPTAKHRSPSPSTQQSKASPPTNAIRQRIGRSGARCGSAARRTSRSSNSNAASTSAPTSPSATTRSASSRRSRGILAPLLPPPILRVSSAPSILCSSACWAALRWRIYAWANSSWRRTLRCARSRGPMLMCTFWRLPRARWR